jgi:MFS family permease
MLLIAAAAVFMSAPGQSFSVAAFVDPMLLELQLDRTNYSVAYMVATLIGGCILPFIGRIVDKLGARIVLPIVALGLGLACCWMFQLTGIVSLYVGFTMIRCLGQGSLTLIGNWIVGEWFQEYRGRAAGVCAVGGTLSVLVMPQLNNVLINQYGWRQAWIILGAIVSVTLIVPAIWFLRDRPEALGLLPDGKFPPADDAATTADAETPAAKPNDAAIRIPDDQSFTAKEALKSPTFWKLASVVATVSLVGTGLMFHQVSILAERDVSRSAALASLGVQAGAATVSTLLAGYLIDRMAARFVLATSMLLEIFAILLLLFLPGPKWVFVYSALLGLHGGIIRSAGSIVWVNYFGRKFQGSVQGISMSIMVLAAALGPVPVALSHDYTGNYDAALWAFLLLPTCAGLAVLTAKPPQRPESVSI